MNAAGQLAAEGRMKGSNKLQDGTARQLTKLGAIEGPFPVTKETIGGYFVIEAADYAEAVELARSCPHIDFGRIEIRQVDVM